MALLVGVALPDLRDEAGGVDTVGAVLIGVGTVLAVAGLAGAAQRPPAPLTCGPRSSAVRMFSGQGVERPSAMAT